MDKLPKFVRLGHSALRLKAFDKVYYRDAGNWDVEYRIIDGKLYSWCEYSDTPWLHKRPLVEITEDEWRKENSGYI